VRKKGFGFVASIALMVTLMSCSNGDDSPSCTFALHGGEPDLTAAPSFSASSVSVGSMATLFVPVDADTSHIRIALIGGINSNNIYVEQLVAEAVVPGAQTLQYQIDTSAYTPGSYYPDIDLCDNSNDCSGVNSGIGVAYTYSLFAANSAHYTRRLFWNNGSVNGAESDACLNIPYMAVN